MSNGSTAPDAPAIWAVVGLLVVALGGAEWVVPGGSGAAAPLPETADDAAHEIRNLYGLTPTDVALIADTLAERTDASDTQTGTRFVVAGYPGADRLNGPLLTRSTASRQMARKGAEQLAGRPVGGGWRQLTVEGRKAPRRRPQLAGAAVYVESDGNRRPCPRIQLERFACAPPGWSHVLRKQVTVGGRDVSCIWSHPLEDRRIVIDFGPVDARSKNNPYRVRTALDDQVADEPGAVDVDIRVGERTIEHRHRAKKGWQSSPPLEIEEAAPVRVAVSADRVGRRHFCFDMQ